MWDGFSVEWDFFVSYTQADRHWAKWIAWQLEEANYRVLVQAQDFVLGTNWVDAMDKGIGNSERTIAARSRLLKKVSEAIARTAGTALPGGRRAVSRKPRFPGTPPAIWNVPAHNPNFTGRGAELAELESNLASESTVTVEAVRGLGGVGKTQLAIEYAHAHRRLRPGVVGGLRGNRRHT
jgi:hypothetical protein